MQNSHAAAGRFHCMFILCNRFVLSVNSALHLQHRVVCYISENKVNHLLLPDKGIHYPFPPEDEEVVFSNVFVVWPRSKKEESAAMC